MWWVSFDFWAHNWVLAKGSSLMLSIHSACCMKFQRFCGVRGCKCWVFWICSRYWWEYGFSFQKTVLKHNLFLFKASIVLIKTLLHVSSFASHIDSVFLNCIHKSFLKSRWIFNYTFSMYNFITPFKMFINMVSRRLLCLPCVFYHIEYFCMSWDFLLCRQIAVV